MVENFPETISEFIQLLRSIVNTHTVAGPNEYDDKKKYRRSINNTEISIKYDGLMEARGVMKEYLQSYRRTDEGKALFNDYGIQWSSGGRPTISIPRDLIERVSRRAGRYAEDAVEQEEEHFKPGRTPYKGHTDYSDARLRILYNQYGFRQAEDRLRKTWNSELSVQLKEQLFNKFIGNVGKIIRGEVGISLRTVDDEQNAEILASQKLFLSATLTDGSISKQHLYIRNVFSAASCFKNKLSRSRVAKKLGLRRQSVSKIASATSSSTYVRQITYTAILALNI